MKYLKTTALQKYVLAEDLKNVFICDKNNLKNCFIREHNDNDGEFDSVP